MNYQELYERYKKENAHRPGGRYIQRFVNLITKEKIPLSELDDFHEAWKHQLSRGFYGSTIYIYRWECRKFIDFVINLYTPKTQVGTHIVDKEQI